METLNYIITKVERPITAKIPCPHRITLNIFKTRGLQRMSFSKVFCYTTVVIN